MMLYSVIQINRTINSNKSKKKEFIIFNHSPDQKIILVKIKNNQTSTENEKKGGTFYNFVKSNLLIDLTFFDNNILPFHLLDFFHIYFPIHHCLLFQ